MSRGTPRARDLSVLLGIVGVALAGRAAAYDAAKSEAGFQTTVPRAAVMAAVRKTLEDEGYRIESFDADAGTATTAPRMLSEDDGRAECGMMTTMPSPRHVHVNTTLSVSMVREKLVVRGHPRIQAPSPGEAAGTTPASLECHPKSQLEEDLAGHIRRTLLP